MKPPVRWLTVWPSIISLNVACIAQQPPAASRALAWDMSWSPQITLTSALHTPMKPKNAFHFKPFYILNALTKSFLMCFKIAKL